MIHRSLSIIWLFLVGMTVGAQDAELVLSASHLFDGEQMHEDWSLTMAEGRIIWVGPASQNPHAKTAKQVRYDEATILPGLIEGHAHMLLHPYNETSWNDQVLKESLAERSIRAAVHAEKTLHAGFTTVRDLGSEGAGYADVGLKQAIEKGVIPGPRLIVAGPAIVATGSYGPKGFADQVQVPLGAEVADGKDDLTKAVRRQIGHGADFIKVYADYRWGPQGQAMPTFTEKELALIVELAESSGRVVVAHASTPEGMRRAAAAGVSTIEHGDGGTREVFALMSTKNIALCPTLAAGDAIMQYRGWKKDSEPDPDRIQAKRKSFALALEEGVPIMAGGDVGVFPHGDNVRELEMMVDYGMNPLDVLRSATSGNARIMGLNENIGHLKRGFTADITIVSGIPSENISTLRNVMAVYQAGHLVFTPE